MPRKALPIAPIAVGTKGEAQSLLGYMIFAHEIISATYTSAAVPQIRALHSPHTLSPFPTPNHPRSIVCCIVSSLNIYCMHNFNIFWSAQHWQRAGPGPGPELISVDAFERKKVYKKWQGKR